jgi:hypothetical protein
MTVTLRPYEPADYDVVRRWIDDPVITGGYFDGEADLGDLVMYAMTRDDWEGARKTWNSTG